MEYCQRIVKFQERVNSLGGERKALQQIVNENTAKLTDIKKQIIKNERAVLLLQLVIENRQMNIVKLFQDTVTSALKEIFGESYKFKIGFDKRNNSTTVDFLIHTGEYKGYIPVKMCQGTSISEVIGVILQTVFVHLLKGSKFLALDESFTGIEYERQSLVGIFLRKICEKFNMQIIMVSHCEPIVACAEKVIDIK